MTKTKTMPPEALEICEERSLAFKKYEQAVLEGYTFDPDQPPQTLMTGYAIMRLIRRTQ